MSDPTQFVSEPLCIGHCLHRALAVFSERPFMGVRAVDCKSGTGTRSDFKWITYRETFKHASAIAKGLVAFGIQRRVHVGILSENCPEWMYTDFACALNDMVPVGMHTSWPVEDIAAVVENADLSCVFVSADMVKVFTKKQWGKLKLLVVLDSKTGDGSTEEIRKSTPNGIQIVTLSELISRGLKGTHATWTNAGGDQVELDPSKTHADEEDAFTLIYSSGTSGAPKGVLVSKKRWKKDANASAVNVTPNQRAVSYMALAHGADRGIVWQTCFCGGSVGFASTDTHTKFLADLQCVKPEFFLGLSHTWNRFYFEFRQMLTRATLADLTDLLMKEAAGHSRPLSNRELHESISEVKSSGLWEALVDLYCQTRKGKHTRQQVVLTFRNNLGGSFQTVATGGAHTSTHVIEFMEKVCMVPGNEGRVFNSYGATEFPGISQNGAISGAVELKLRDLEDMGYTTKDRSLHHSIVDVLFRIFQACTGGGNGVAISTELVAEMKKSFETQVNERIAQLPRKSQHRIRFKEVVEKASMRGYQGLATMFNELMKQKQTKLEAYQVRLKSEEKLSNVEVENIKQDCENLSHEVKMSSVTFEDFMFSFRSHYGEYMPRGEILVRAKDGSHSKEYWRNPSKSKATWVDGGWYCTGDVGELEYNPKRDKQGDSDSMFSASACKSKSRVLRIIDRCKYMVELYIRGRSVWVAMQKLEQSIYQKLSCVHQICLVADRNQPVMVAIVVPSEDFISQWQQKALKASLNVKDCCTDPEFKLAILARLQRAGSNANVKDYEIPKHVILEHDPWTVHNECLSAVGKPKRGYLKTVKYIDELDRLYAKDEVKEEMETLQTRPPSSRNSRPQTPIDRPKTPTGAQAMHSRRIVALHELVAAATEACRGVLEVEEKEKKVFPADFPFSEKHKYQDWRFKVSGDSKAESELNEELGHLKEVGRKLQRSWDKWSKAKKESVAFLKGRWEKVLRDTESKVEDKINKFVQWNHSPARQLDLKPEKLYEENKYEKDPYTGTPVKGVVEKLMDKALAEAERQTSFTRTVDPKQCASSLVADIIREIREGKFRSVVAYAQFAKAGEMPEEEELLRYEWNEKRQKLESIAERHRHHCPAQLTFQFDWCWPAQDIKDNKAPAPSIPVGNAKIWCFLSGRLIEEDVSHIGRPRYHVLDGPTTTDISLKYQHWMDTLWKHLVSESVLGSRYAARVSDAQRAMDALKQFNPWVDAALSRDIAHWTHLRHMTKKQFAREDTPIAIIMNACRAYGDRLALGMNSEYSSSRVPAAAGLSCADYDGHYWLRYGQVKVLVERLSKHLMQLSLHKSMIGLSGYNDFSFVISDFAVARASSCSVGLHATYTQPEVEKVLRNCKPVALIVARDLIRARPNGWSIECLDAKTSVKHVIVMEMDREEVQCEQKRLDAKRSGKAVPVLHSLLGCLSPSTDELKVELLDQYKCNGVQTPHPIDKNKTVNLFTLMYTSGSSGTPKGVMVATETFQQDMGEPTSASPLVTVSYIPLSHSSDRVKVWEFITNGGRVGFAEYRASNWSAHEKSKKDGLLDSFGAENNVRGLFDQVARLQPSAMSCPPRIWNGLHYIYQQELIKFKARDSPNPEEKALDAIRSMFGSRVGFLATGGAPTRPDVIEFAKRLFEKATFVNSYGTTESGGITSNGTPIWSKKVEIRLKGRPEIGLMGDGIGEIQVRSPQLHIGYYKNPEKTAEAWLEGGWYATGDLGRLDDFGKLHILERISAVRCLKDGTMMFPGKLVSLLEQTPLVRQVFVDAQPANSMAVAVVVLDLKALAVYCHESKLSEDKAIKSEALHDRILSDFAKLSQARNYHVDKIKAVVLTKAPWTVENKMLTGSQKKRVKLIREKFALDLEKIYSA